MDTANEREAIVGFYAAATGERSWTRALDALGEGVGATTVVLLAQLAGARGVELLGAVGMDSEALRACRECFDLRPVPRTDGVARPHTAEVEIRETFCAPRLLLTRLDTHAVAVRLAAFRLHSQEPFGPDDCQAFEALTPHLRQAIRTAMHLERANDLRGAMQALGEQFAKGVAVLDADNRVLHANTAFERICSAEDGLMTRRGVLTTSRENEPAVARLLARGLRGESGGRLEVLRPSGRPPYTLLVSPLAPALSVFGAREARVTVAVSDPASVSAPSEAVLSVAYGLTRAESRMVARLVDGATVCHTAEQLGISLNTARTHLKRAMAKTGVSRQTDLVRLMLSRQ